MLFLTKKNRKKHFTLIASLFTLFACSAANAQTFNIQKRNTNFSIDGNHGGVSGLQVYLYQTSLNNVNQQWIEIDRGNGFYSYQKQNTNVCLDGGNRGENRQAVILFVCRSSNQNQHWRKVATAGGSIRLEKRNSPNFSIDGNRGGRNRQSIYLWRSDSRNVNQQWLFTNINGNNNGGNNQPESELPRGVHEDIVRIADIAPEEILRNPGGESWKDSYSVGDRCYCDTTGDHDVNNLLADTPFGRITTQEACDIIGPGPGSRGNPIYNDIQCGNGPANDAGDEDYCPGRVDIGREGCTHIGPRWNFN